MTDPKGLDRHLIDKPKREPAGLRRMRGSWPHPTALSHLYPVDLRFADGLDFANGPDFVIRAILQSIFEPFSFLCAGQVMLISAAAGRASQRSAIFLPPTCS
jgi:hypothetical protein